MDNHKRLGGHQLAAVYDAGDKFDRRHFKCAHVAAGGVNNANIATSIVRNAKWQYERRSSER